jgi:hypothetical protein
VEIPETPALRLGMARRNPQTIIGNWDALDAAERD